MRHLMKACLLASSLGVIAIVACDETVVAPLHDGKAECLELGEKCHEVAEALGGRYEECHETGHDGDGKQCLKVYDECIALCEAAVIPEGGAGGAGGEGGAGGAHAEGGAHSH